MTATPLFFRTPSPLCHNFTCGPSWQPVTSMQGGKPTFPCHRAMDHTATAAAACPFSHLPEPDQSPGIPTTHRSTTSHRWTLFLGHVAFVLFSLSHWWWGRCWSSCPFGRGEGGERILLRRSTGSFLWRKKQDLGGRERNYCCTYAGKPGQSYCYVLQSNP